MKILFLWLICLLLLVVPIAAQDNSAEPIRVGTLITGRIDDNTSRIVYSMNGSRGAVVRLRLNATSGDLDPVLTMFDPDGRVIFRRDDNESSRNVDIQLTFQENGTYLLVVGRFAYALGTTSGDYELAIERVGVSSEEGSTLQYGIPVTNTISHTQAQIFFTFEAQAGDIINVSMVRSSGTLDPYIQVVDSERFLVAENDDVNGNTRNSSIQSLLIEESGTYIIVATRYGQAAGNSVGSFVLVVEESRNSGLGNNQQAPEVIVMNQTVDGELSEDNYERYYTFEGQRNQIISIVMERTAFAGQLDGYLILTNAGFSPLIEIDDFGESRNPRLENYRLPADGLYHIIVTRFGRANGETFGAYRLTLLNEGFAFDGISPDVPQLLYGTTVEDTINDADPDSLFVFWGTEGEKIIIAMDAAANGNLDPVLELLDINLDRMLRDDDSGFDNNARLEWTLTYTGVYFIRATRYSGSSGNNNTTGSYRLVLTRVLGD